VYIDQDYFTTKCTHVVVGKGHHSLECTLDHSNANLISGTSLTQKTVFPLTGFNLFMLSEASELA